VHYPPLPHRPQAYRARRLRARAAAPSATHTWPFCLAALALLVAVTALATSRRAAAAPAPRGAAATAPVPTPPRLTRPAAIVGRLGASRQGRQLRAQVTAYSASVEEGTAWGITRSGTRARPGVVAVDPQVIPLGSRVRIAGLPGVYTAEDTGGGIHGAHLDVFMDSRAAAFRFGRQTGVLVEVLD